MDGSTDRYLEGWTGSAPRNIVGLWGSASPNLGSLDESVAPNLLGLDGPTPRNTGCLDGLASRYLGGLDVDCSTPRHRVALTGSFHHSLGGLVGPAPRNIRGLCDGPAARNVICMTILRPMHLYAFFLVRAIRYLTIKMGMRIKQVDAFFRKPGNARSYGPSSTR